LLEKFRDQLKQHFGARLQSVILFGSQARGDAGPDSDVDVAVVLADGARRLIDGPLLMPIVLSRSELDHLRAREDMLAQSLDREGVAVALATEAATTTPRAGSTTLRFT
jgi:predicted nucleotidyltransferase